MSSSVEALDTYFDALRHRDWRALAGCLAEGVERNGPYLDVVRGREAYVDFLSAVLPKLENYKLRVIEVHELKSGAAFVLLSETLDVAGVSTEFPEAILFDFDTTGLIDRVNIYIKQPGRHA